MRYFIIVHDETVELAFKHFNIGLSHGFGSLMSHLKRCSNIEGPDKMTRGRWMGANQNSYVRTGVCLKFKPKDKTLEESDEHTNQQHRNDPLKVMNAVEKEWD
jgi:hypothetical protein